EALNAQEVRNVAFRGPLNDLIYDLAGEPFFRRQLKITGPKSPAYRNMTDAEFVLRFLTLMREWESFSGALGRSMDEFMRAHQHASAQELGVFRSQFETSLTRCEALWRIHAFQRPEGPGWRAQALAGVYDAQMIAVARLNQSAVDRLKAKRPAVASAV